MTKLPRQTAIALVAASAFAAVSASAFDLPHWLGGKSATPVITASTNLQPQADVPNTVPLADARALVPDYREIVKRFGPAVVGITVSGMHKASAEEAGPAGNDPFCQFFRGIPGLPQGLGQRGGSQSEPFSGQGSGFIVSADGLILTNAHVVRDAKEVTVRLADRHEFAAKVIGADPVTDVALLRVDAKQLPTVRLGHASEVEVGDRVLAIGAPYGLEQTATQGIISAKGRSLPGDSAVPFLQTDAAVNPGNSGGPLFAGNGEVVGINAQIYSRSGGFQGLSFAVPIDVALQVKDQLLKTGKVEHARLGVQVQDLTQSLADSFGMASPDGAVVSQVSPHSAAERAGLKAGDVIGQVNDTPVRHSGELSSLISMAQPGQDVKLKVWRDHGWTTLNARLGALQDDAQAQANLGDQADGTPQIGLALRSLSKSELHELGVQQGLLVQGTDGAAQRAGIQEGAVLLAVNGKPLASVQELRQQLDKHPKTLALLVQRDGQRIFVPVNLG